MKNKSYMPYKSHLYYFLLFVMLNVVVKRRYSAGSNTFLLSNNISVPQSKNSKTKTGESLNKNKKYNRFVIFSHGDFLNRILFIDFCHDSMSVFCSDWPLSAKQEKRFFFLRFLHRFDGRKKTVPIR